MAEAFQILESSKTGLESAEGLIVVRDGICFLRILGGEPRWTLMTATADEDDGRIQACPDQPRLVESALRLCAERGDAPIIETDRSGRKYVKMGTFTREPGESDDEFQDVYNALFKRFFEIFDGCEDRNPRGRGELSELYDALATDDQGGDVYLSDGVWLSADGSLRDRGR